MDVKDKAPAGLDLIVIPKETAMEVFTTEGAILPYLKQIESAVVGIVPDLSTKKGRDAIASTAFKVAKSKTYLDGVGKELVDELKRKPALIDATRKQAREFLDKLRDQVRQPLTDWENAEQARVDDLKRRLCFFEDVCLGLADLSCAEIRSRMEQVVSTEMGESWQEFAGLADQAKMKAERELSEAFQKREKYEAEQEELARLRAEKEERDRKDREEQIAREAAANAAQAERDRAAMVQQDAVRKIREAEEAAENARLEAQRQQEENERQLREANERAERAAQAERDRIEAEQRQQEAEAKAREQDKEHRRQVNTAAMLALIDGGLSQEAAKTAVTLIAQRKIPGITITY